MRYLQKLGLRDENTLFCFSPPVILATIIIEVLLVVYVIYRYKMTSIVRVATYMLLLLAVFQFVEYNSCDMGTAGIIWSQFGYVLITLLPPLGLHLIENIAGRKTKILTKLASIASASIILAVLFAPDILSAPFCGGNYVVFLLSEPFNTIYSFYYLGMLVAGIVLANQWSKIVKPPVRLALRWLITGYLAFLIPTGLAYVLIPSTFVALPSIMCGFAVIFALILALKIVPAVAKGTTR